ncbi:MAG: hypothetical protein Q7R99_00605 [bacterium]|nr:hypothetical protein [bacterium]
MIDYETIDGVEVGKAPNGEPIIHITVQLKDKTFRHYLGCREPKRASKITGQAGERIPEERLQQDILLFKKKLEEGGI